MTRLSNILLILFFITLPIERILIVDISGYNIRPVYLFMGLFILTNLRKSTPVLVFAISFLVIVSCLFSVINARDIGIWSANLIWALLNIIFFIFFTSYTKREGALTFIIDIYVKTAVFWSIILILQWLASFIFPQLAYGFVGPFPRVHALMYESSYVPIYLFPPLVMSIYFKKYKPAVLIIIACLCCFSRTAWLMVALLIFFSLIWGTRKNIAIFGFLCALPLIFAVFFTPEENNIDSPSSFVRSAINLTDQSSTIPRLNTWNEGLEIFLDYPITGVGIGNYGIAYYEKYNNLSNSKSIKDIKTTNLFTEILAEMGSLGILTFLLWCILPVVKANYKLGLQKELVIGWVIVCISFMFIQTWWRPYIWVFASILYSVVIYKYNHIVLQTKESRNLKSLSSL